VLSEVGALISSVIQGSCLGPLLFVLYVNDIVNVFANGVMCKLYADDIKMYTVIKADVDCSTFQSNLDRLQQWSDKWQLKIAYKKCCILEIGNSSKFAKDYFLQDNCISNVSTCKDLGIIIDQRLSPTFTSHINSIVTRAHARASLTHKCFLSRDRAFCIMLGRC
jgi:hypothetical protein